MVTAEQIIAIVDDIVAADSPDAVVLFGSYAYGTPTYDSDVDLLIVRDYDVSNPHVGVELRMRVDAAYPVDLIVRSRSEIADRIGSRDWFLMEITEKGVTLYDASDAGVGRKGRDRLRRRLCAASRVEGEGDSPVGTDMLSRAPTH